MNIYKVVDRADYFMFIVKAASESEAIDKVKQWKIKNEVISRGNPKFFAYLLDFRDDCCCIFS